MLELLNPLNLKLLGQLVLSVILGSSIGIERRLAKKEIGMRTFAIVALGSTLFSIISIHALKFVDTGLIAGFDPTRIAAQIVTGVGFIGAGIVIFSHSRLSGVTTASGLWLAAAIGMAVGFEFYAMAIFATMLTLIVFVLFWFIEEKIVARFPSYREPKWFDKK